MKRVNQYGVKGINEKEQERLEKYLTEMDDHHVKLYLDQYGRLFDEYNNYIADVEETDIY